MKKVILYFFIALFLVAVVFHFSISHIKSSSEWTVAEQSIRQNQEIRELIGSVKGFGYYTSEDEDYIGGQHTCVLNMTPVGEKGELKVLVYLQKTDSTEWVVHQLFYSGKK